MPFRKGSRCAFDLLLKRAVHLNALEELSLSAVRWSVDAALGEHLPQLVQRCGLQRSHFLRRELVDAWMGRS